MRASVYACVCVWGGGGGDNPWWGKCLIPFSLIAGQALDTCVAPHLLILFRDPMNMKFRSVYAYDGTGAVGSRTVLCVCVCVVCVCVCVCVCVRFCVCLSACLSACL